MIYLKKISFSLLITILTLLFLLFLVTIFNYFDLFNYKIMHILTIIIPILSIMLGGLYLGKKAHKKGYLEGIKLGFIFCLILLFVNLILGDTINLKDLIFYLILIISAIIGSMAGINIKKS